MLKAEYVKNNEEAFNIVKNIRTEVFQTEQGVNPVEDIDEYDKAVATDYVLVYCDEKAVGTGRMIYLDSGVKLGRIAVIKPYRGRGLGAVIVKALVKKAFENGEEAVNINSQNHAIGFYEKLGFEICGKELYEIGIAHTPMRVTPDSFKGE